MFYYNLKKYDPFVSIPSPNSTLGSRTEIYIGMTQNTLTNRGCCFAFIALHEISGCVSLRASNKLTSYFGIHLQSRHHGILANNNVIFSAIK